MVIEVYALDAKLDASEALRQVVHKLLLDRVLRGMRHGGWCRERWAGRASRPPQSSVVALLLSVGLSRAVADEAKDQHIERFSSCRVVISSTLLLCVLVSQTAQVLAG